MLYLALMHFIVDLAPKWVRENTFYHPLLHFIVDFAHAAWLSEQIFYFFFLVSIDFARQWLWRWFFFLICSNILRSSRNLSEQDIYDLIQRSAKKSRVLDPLPTTLVCDSLDVLLPVITKLVNTPLATSYFPTEWKQAIVNPLLKKGANDVTHKNLRPISNLQFVSKITERAKYIVTWPTTNCFLYFSLPIGEGTARKKHYWEL